MANTTDRSTNADLNTLHRRRHSTTLSERASKELLATYGVPLAAEEFVTTPAEAVAAAERIGFPVVAKLNGDKIAHKTERGLVRLRLGDGAAVERAAAELLAAARDDDGEVTVLVAPMVSGNRELIVGLIRDPQFGATVMLGVGGILAEAVADVVFRPAPLDERSATSMIDDLATQKLLGEFRGEHAVDRRRTRRRAGRARPARRGAARRGERRHQPAHRAARRQRDRRRRPRRGRHVAAVRRCGGAGPATTDRRAVPGAVRAPRRARHRCLEPPRQVRVRLAAQPARQRLRRRRLRHEPEGRGGARRQDRRRHRRPAGRCHRSRVRVHARPRRTPICCGPARPRASAPRSSPRRATARPATRGARRSDELVALADELGILLAGPNGQGVVSTPANLCAQIVAPYPPAGHIGVASQSGNFVSTFLNLSRLSGVGISRAVSAGNAAAVTVADYLGWYATDDATTVGPGLRRGDHRRPRT